VRLSRCADDVSTWCKSRRLQLNANKTEAIWFGSQANLASLNSLDCSLRVGLFTVQPSTVVRDLGLHLDNELSMKQHVTKVTATCYYHLHRLRQIWRHVRSEVTTQLVLALVISRLAYCNAALADLPQTTIAPLQRIQNAAARLVFELGPRKHARHSMSSPTALAACLLAHPVQTVLYYALSFQRKLPRRIYQTSFRQ